MVGISLLLLPPPLLLNSPLVHWTLDPEPSGSLGGQHKAPCCEQRLMAGPDSWPKPLLRQTVRHSIWRVYLVYVPVFTKSINLV